MRRIRLPHVFSFALYSQIVLLSATLFWLLALVWTASACEEHFFDGAAPAIENPALSTAVDTLCYTGFATLHSGVSRTPLWSAEHLTAERLARASRMTRNDTFHPDPNLHRSHRSELSDYARTGYDRGHMAPSGDMPDERSQHESFSLANIVPQNPDNNRILWAGIESATRAIARQSGEIYVVTGPLFEGSSVLALHDRVMVPTGFYKAIYNPATGAAGAYIVKNEAGSGWESISIVELRRRSGIDVFPAISEDVKRKRLRLPEPESRRSRYSNFNLQQPGSPGLGEIDADAIAAMLEKFRHPF